MPRICSLRNDGLSRKSTGEGALSSQALWYKSQQNLQISLDGHSVQMRPACGLLHVMAMLTKEVACTWLGTVINPRSIQL